MSKKTKAVNLQLKKDFLNFLEHYLTFYKERYGTPVHYGSLIEMEHNYIIKKAALLLNKHK